MKFLHFGACFALCMALEAKEIRRISRLIPLEDWIDFKNRTRDVKPLDKLIGKLRATYDFVFHKPDNVSNVGKIIDRTNEKSSENVTTENSNVSFIERRKLSSRTNVARDMSDRKEYVNGSTDFNETENKNFSNDRLDEGFVEDEGSFEKIENLDEPLLLEHLEILDNEDSLENFDEVSDDTENKNFPPHSSFALPYAIAQAFFRWIISLYFSASSNFTKSDTSLGESA